MPKTTYGYTATKDQLLKRLARAEGQVRGVTEMVKNDRYCIDVITQINAAQAALDRIALGLLDDHARHCMSKAKDQKSARAQVEELMGAVGRLVKR
jgi:CsoR family transcriptional regulator, copper-sensing transcriptional repressor